MNRYHAPVLPFSDVEASVRWYEETLGFRATHVNRDPEGEDPTNCAVLWHEGVSVHLLRSAEARRGLSIRRWDRARTGARRQA
jgi:catechol 2,3-dioxygenase-like lactoylglutathione lyase family enzyme